MHIYTRRSSSLLLAAMLTLSISIFALPTAYAQAEPAPSITILPPAGPPGIPITVKGSDFTPGANVDLYWFGYIVDIPYTRGHLGYYAIKTGITIGADGSFTTVITAPYDFSDVPHFVNATQNGAGTGIVNATFQIVPSLHLSPEPAKYKQGQEVFLHVYGAPTGFFPVPPEMRPMVLKFTYDNTEWGFATSHLETEGPIVTGGFGVGGVGDVGGNITIRFKAVGGLGRHSIRAYVGGSQTPPYLPCEIGGEVVFVIKSLSQSTKPILTALDELGTSEETVMSLNSDVGAIEAQTSVTSLQSSVDLLSGQSSTMTALSAVSLVIAVTAIGVAAWTSRKRS